MSSEQGRSGRSFVPPRWIYPTIWTPDRAGYAITGGRLGLRSVADGRLVTLRLRMTGCRSGAEREIPIVILAPTDEGADA